MSPTPDIALHTVGIAGIRIRHETTVSLRTEDPKLMRHLIRTYPGLNRTRQFRVEPWIKFRGIQRKFYVFKGLNQEALTACLAGFEASNPRHPSTVIF